VERELKIGIVSCRTPPPPIEASNKEAAVGKPFWISGDELVVIHRCPNMVGEGDGRPHPLSASSEPWVCPQCEAQVSYAKVWARWIGRY
jgi:hypothetical protein